MLEMIKFGAGVAGIVVPALASLKAIELTDTVKQTVSEVMGKIDYSLECIDKQFAKVDGSLPEDLAVADSGAIMTQQDLANALNTIQGLEGIELRQLGSFLQTSAKDNLLGNLYRMTTSEGHVKWVCRDHYRAGYREKQIQHLRDVVQQAKGEFDEQLGKIKITLTSTIVASEFYSAITKAKGVLELDVLFDWKCSKKDTELFEKAIRITRVSILKLDVRYLQTTLGSVLRSTSSQFGTFFQLQNIPHMKSIHLIISTDLLAILSFQPNIQLFGCQLTFELSFSEVGKQDFDSIMRAIISNSPLTAVGLNKSTIGDERARTLSEALKRNSKLIELHLRENLIGKVGAWALGEALKVNSNLSILNLVQNSIRDNEVLILSSALKINSTLTHLNLSHNSIGDAGASILSEALKINSNLRILNLEMNVMKEMGAWSLAEALDRNSTLTSLELGGNSIGDIGTQQLSKALKYNSTLKLLHLEGCSIKDRGAIRLSEAIKINSTLESLYLKRT